MAVPAGGAEVLQPPHAEVAPAGFRAPAKAKGAGRLRVAEESGADRIAIVVQTEPCAPSQIRREDPAEESGRARADDLEPGMGHVGDEPDRGSAPLSGRAHDEVPVCGRAHVRPRPAAESGG